MNKSIQTSGLGPVSKFGPVDLNKSVRIHRFELAESDRLIQTGRFDFTESVQLIKFDFGV